MLGSGNDEARRNACWAVAVAAADTETTSELCRAGGCDQTIFRSAVSGQSTIYSLFSAVTSFKSGFKPA